MVAGKENDEKAKGALPKSKTPVKCGASQELQFLATPHWPVQAANVFPRVENAYIAQNTQQEKT